MSYSPGEAVQDEERHLKFLRALTEKYPQARQRDGRWYADEVRREDCEFEVYVAHIETIPERCLIQCRLYIELEGGWVYRSGHDGLLSTALNELRTKNPGAYAALLAEVRKV